MSVVVVIGASPNPARMSYKVTGALYAAGYEVLAIGIHQGDIDGVPITLEPIIPDEKIDLVTLYINPTLQPAYYDYILALKPSRVIFNPGTENTELMDLCKANNIEPLEACTMVMLCLGQL